MGNQEMQIDITRNWCPDNRALATKMKIGMKQNGAIIFETAPLSLSSHFKSRLYELQSRIKTLNLKGKASN